MLPAPKKLYYKIGEVCGIVGVEAHVLRFWETEFPILSPPKNRSGQRIYRPKDIELLLKIKRLLYEDGFTIAGARKQLGVRTQKPGSAPPAAPAAAQAGSTEHPRPELSASPAPDAIPPSQGPLSPDCADSSTDQIQRVRKELENILTLLDRG
jgi:DNA-binding transcriptional MerR regulator